VFYVKNLLEFFKTQVLTSKHGHFSLISLLYKKTVLPEKSVFYQPAGFSNKTWGFQALF
jgi:hypothetical protein